jgi:type IV secretory pathway TrbL component
MIPTQNVLTELTTAFKTSAENAVLILTPYAIGTAFIVMTIAYIVFILGEFTDDESNQEVKHSGDILNYLKISMPELIKYAGFLFLVFNYKDIINAIIASFFKIGGLAGGTPIAANVFSSPSLIANLGIDLMYPIWTNYVNENIGKIVADLAIFITGAVTGGATSIVIKGLQGALGVYKPNSILQMALMIIITLFVIGCFFIMAINILVIQIEFAIVASLSLILVPFGVWERTSFIFETAKNNIITLGIKYMVLTTILSISMAIIKNISMPTSPSYEQLIVLVIMVMGLTALTIFVPNKIASEI